VILCEIIDNLCTITDRVYSEPMKSLCDDHDLEGNRMTGIIVMGFKRLSEAYKLIAAPIRENLNVRY
jgi:hypothetical protein